MLDLSPVELELDDKKIREFERFMKRKRIEAGYPNQIDAARAIGVSQDLISRLESRFSPNVRVGEFSKVLDKYNIAPNEAFLILGLYDSPIPVAEHLEYVRKEIQPLLDNRSMEELKRIKLVLLGLLRALPENK